MKAYWAHSLNVIDFGAISDSFGHGRTFSASWTCNFVDPLTHFIQSFRICLSHEEELEMNSSGATYAGNPLAE